MIRIPVYVSFILSLILSSDICSQGCTTIASNMGDVTARMINLGNIPKQEGMTGRELNIWDLQVYNNKVYLGYGSTTTNAGPIDLYCYDPATNVFLNEGVLQSEAIERFRVWDNKLFVPNSDPKITDTRKYVYLDGGTMTEVFDDHLLAHVRDIYYFNNQYYLGGNTRCPRDKNPSCTGLLRQNSVSGSFSNNLLESELIVVEPDSNSRWNWFFGFLEIDNKLIVPNAMFTETYHPFLGYPDNLFFQIDMSGNVEWSAFMPLSTRLQHHMFYPVDNTVTTVDTIGIFTSLRPFESVAINNDYLYSLRSYSPFDTIYHEAYNNSKGLIFKDDLLCDAEFVVFPNAQAVGEDLFVNNGEVYALANTKIGPGSFNVFVYKSSTPTALPSSWQEVCRFNSACMVRSFEYYDGKFYFGLGNNHGDLTNGSGLLRCLTVCNTSPPAGAPCDDNDPCTNGDQSDGYGGCIGAYMDSDGGGVCDLYDNCPNQFAFAPTLQFDDSFIARRKITFNGTVNLNCNVSMNADTMLLLGGTWIDAASNYLADIIGCP